MKIIMILNLIRILNLKMNIENDIENDIEMSTLERNENGIKKRKREQARNKSYYRPEKIYITNSG